MKTYKLHNLLWDLAGLTESATMLCPWCGQRTAVKALCVLFDLEPECVECGNSVSDPGDCDVRIASPRMEELVAEAESWAKDEGFAIDYQIGVAA